MVNSNIGNRAAAKVLQQTTDLLAIDEPALAGRTRGNAVYADWPVFDKSGKEK